VIQSLSEAVIMQVDCVHPFSCGGFDCGNRSGGHSGVFLG